MLPHDTFAHTFSFLSNDHLYNVVLASWDFHAAGQRYIKPENYSRDVDIIPNYLERIAVRYDFYEKCIADECFIGMVNIVFDAMYWRSANSHIRKCLAEMNTLPNDNRVEYLANCTNIVDLLSEDLSSQGSRGSEYYPYIYTHNWIKIIRAIAPNTQIDCISPHSGLTRFMIIAEPDEKEALELIVACYSRGILDKPETLSLLDTVIRELKSYVFRGACIRMTIDALSYIGDDDEADDVRKMEYYSEVDTHILAIDVAALIVEILSEDDDGVFNPRDALDMLDASGAITHEYDFHDDAHDDANKQIREAETN